VKKNGSTIATFVYDRDTSIGRDTVTSAALTTAGRLSPIGLTSAPLQGAALLNDVGLLYTSPLVGPFSMIPKSLTVRDQHFRVDWDKE